MRFVEVSDAMVAAIPRGSIRVPRDDFATVWRAAESSARPDPAGEVVNWHAAGVAATCRWLARATVRSPGVAPFLARSPITNGIAGPEPEAVAAEHLEADKMAIRLDRGVQVPDWVTQRPGWVRGVVDTFNWVWVRHAGALVGSEPDGRGGFLLQYEIEYGPPRIVAV